ncbi:hypothetical protein Leryth_011180 [Lithospermum erythrorhizon]|nr:hypothetical protein Leryth_011180 [Lithospermum erythrorhizon]
MLVEEKIIVEYRSFNIIGFAVLQVFLYQITNFSQIKWLPFVFSLISFTYSSIGFGLAKLLEQFKKVSGFEIGGAIGKSCTI